MNNRFVVLFKVKRLVIALILLRCLSVNAQQDAQFSQYMFNGIYINPAYAGYKEQLNVHAFYRKQFVSVEGSPTTMSLAVDAISRFDNVGLALQISSDQLGAQKNLSAFGNYAYRLKLNEDGTSRLAFGLGLGAIQLGIDGSLLSPNELEPDQPLGMESLILPDARAGIFYSDNYFYAGFSADNLISRYINSSKSTYIPRLKTHYYLTSGALFHLSDEMKLKPSFLLKEGFGGGPASLDLSGFLILSDRIWLGAAYRTGIKLFNAKDLQKDLSILNSAIAAMQIYPLPQLSIGYAYDFSVGSMRGYSGNTHEISVTYTFKKRGQRILMPFKCF